MHNVSSDGKKVAIRFDYTNPKTLIESFESLLKQQDTKNALAIAKAAGGFARANDALIRYYQVLCLEALSDMAPARNEALALAMLVDGVTDSDVPELGDKGAVTIPKSFFDRYPDAFELYRQFGAYARETKTRFEARFILGSNEGPVTGLSRRVFFGEELGQFDYWPMNFGKRKIKSGDLCDLDRDSVARLLIDDIVRRALPADFRKRSRSNDAVATFGSCFAVNLARSLEVQDIRSQSFRIEEAVNTTRANLLLLEYVLFGRESETDFFSRTISAAQCQEIRKAVQNAALIVLTVGVSPVTEWKEMGRLCLSDRYKELFERGEVVQRFTTVEENRDNIVAIVEIIRERNPSADVFVTLSPVPLLGVADGSSVVSRDVISKSTLRLAIDEAAKQCKFIYWPSFEVVKWIAPHVTGDLNYQAYAEDDKNSRHVSKWLIDIITSKFIEYTFEDVSRV